ncbi:Regulator of RpoS [Caprobacter fermentans]|uniref:Stage 0 sporulation protein A homolog n=1 Tax=Caproicibacter fermentans TaxID=2576756 RepID=A0A6N8HXQ4_9FIRM|nr:response regulator [Caproicibacter fermentans]MVB10300.1 Regulator of RpoS [Caproicibacter fermentans]
MYRILITDDEKDERKTIGFLLKKFHFQLTIDEAENGREALEMLRKRKADILFTDVRMPFMLGTDLAARAQEMYPDLQIIFFSGYNDFPYVKKALSLGAVDYILKPIHPEELKKIMLKTIQRLDAQARTVRQERLASVYLQNYILSGLLYGTKAELLYRKYRKEDLDFLEKYDRLFLLQFDDPVFGWFPQNQFEKTAGEVFGGQPFHFLNLNPNQSVIFLQKEETLHRPVAYIAQCLQKRFSSVFAKSCYLSISSPFSGTDSIAAAYSQAEQALDERFFFMNRYIYPIPDESPNDLENLEDDDALLQAAADAIEFKDGYSLQKSVNLLMAKYQYKKKQSHISVCYIFSRLAQILWKASSAGKDELQGMVEKIYRCQYYDEIRVLISDTLARVLQSLDVGQDSAEHAICIVKQYIQNHYGEELNLTRLAGQVYLSPRYLSDLFIRKTGCGINKYIKTVRMEQAKERVLNTNQKIQDICRDVGYPNFSYFCRSFRETFGQTPESFRTSH